MDDSQMKPSKEAVVAYIAPKDIRDITEADRAIKSPKDMYLLDLYMTRGIKGETREKIVPFAPTPVVNDYCDVVHLVVEAPAGVKRIPQTPDYSAPDYYKWTGEPNQPDVLKYIDINSKEYDVSLSANFNTKNRIPESVRAEAKTSGFPYDMPVVVYDEDPYWWLPVASAIDANQNGDAVFSIEPNGTLSIDLYEANGGPWRCNIKICRNGHKFEGNMNVLKNPPSGKPSTTPTIKKSISGLIRDLTLYIQAIP